jgi:cytochrome c oxidase assembly protein subunit 15
MVGWWMVKSGLGDDRRDEKHEIRVKAERLATHLTMAVVTYGALLKTGLDILGLEHKNIPEQVSKLSKDAIRHASKLRTGSIVLTGLTGVTIISGALVAGNDAGRAFNTWPKMDDRWIPAEIMEIQPWYRNLTDNTATVQFNHRMLGTSVAITGLSLVALGLSPSKSALITPQTRKGLYAVGLASVGQVTLGITTLLYYVPISLAATHQLGSIVVLTSGIYLAHSLRYVRPAVLRASRAAIKPSPAAVPKLSNTPNVA